MSTSPRPSARRLRFRFSFRSAVWAVAIAAGLTAAPLRAQSLRADSLAPATPVTPVFPIDMAIPALTGGLPGAAPQTGPASDAYTCSPTHCSGGDCRCASTDAPGAFSRAETPQFVLVTWDDCVNAYSEAYVRPLLDGLRNPDGRPVPSTYFVSLERCPSGGVTAPALVQARHAAGDEIAVHTVTHGTNTTSTKAEWEREIMLAQATLQRYVPAADVAIGFRAPKLATNAALYRVLYGLGFLYDSSIVERAFYAPITRGPRAFIWPFTYDAWPDGPHASTKTRRPQSCQDFVTENVCPESAFPGLWQVPAYQNVRADMPIEGVDMGVFDIGGSHEYTFVSHRVRGVELRRSLDAHLQWRLEGNRAPLNLYFHAPGFAETDRTATVRDFLGATLKRGDTWAVTMQGLIEWMRAPVPLSQMDAWYAAYCTRHRCLPGTTGVGADGPDRIADAALHVAPSVTSSGLATLRGLGRDAARVSVLDTAGRTLARHDGPFDASGLLLDVSAHARGVYHVRIDHTDGRTRSVRLVHL